MKYASKKFFAALLACALCAGGVAMAWADVKIDAENFPDENFRQWVKENAAGGKDVLTDAQCAAVTDMNIPDEGISSLKGIEHFTELTALNCYGNELTELDLSHSPALEMLICGDNELAALNLSGSSALETLDCHDNKLTALDLSHSPALKHLDCHNNELTALDLSENGALEELDCNDNALTALDLSRHPALGKVFCMDNALTTLDLSGSRALNTLDCQDNKLTALDLSKNGALEALYCNDNELTALDLSKNGALEFLACEDNELAALDLSKNRNLSGASLPETARVTLPNGDKIAMKDFRVAKGKDGKLRLDLSRYGGKIGRVYATLKGEQEVKEEVKVKSAKGVHTFAPFDGSLTITYRLGRDAELELILSVQEEEEE